MYTDWTKEVHVVLEALVHAASDALGRPVDYQVDLDMDVRVEPRFKLGSGLLGDATKDAQIVSKLWVACRDDNPSLWAYNGWVNTKIADAGGTEVLGDEAYADYMRAKRDG